MELIIGCLFIVVLLIVSVVFGRQQFQNLAKLRERGQMTAEDHSYHLRQCYRRIVGCGLSLLLALLLTGWYILGIGDRIDKVGDRAAKVRAEGKTFQKDDLKDDEKDDMSLGGWYIIAMLFVVFSLLSVAFADLHAIRRYGMRHRRRIREDRMAMLRRQLPQWRRERENRES